MRRLRQWREEIRTRHLTGRELAVSFVGALALSLAVAYQAAEGVTWFPPDLIALSALFISAGTLLVLWAWLVCTHWVIVRWRLSRRTGWRAGSGGAGSSEEG